MHGGKTPAAAKKSALAKAHVEIVAHRGFVEPIAVDDWEANPIHSFEMEFRRTIAWIRYFEDRLNALREKDGDDGFLTWGRTKEEDVNATEFAGVNATDEAKPNVLLELLFRERRHLHDLQKTYISAGLATKKLEMERDMMDRMELAITNIVIAVGANPRDPEVRMTIRRNLLAVEGAA